MKKQNFILIAISFLVLTFSSCSKEDPADGGEEGNETTVQQDKESVKASMNNFYNCLQTLSDGGFADFLYNSAVKYEKRTDTIYYNPSDSTQYFVSTYRGDSWLDSIMGNLEKKVGKFNKDGAFNYSGLKGKYTWDISKKEWNKEASNSIELYFPSEATKTTNNAKLLIDSYEDIEVSYKGEKSKLPKKGHLVAIIDNEKTFEITIKNVSYDVKDNFTMPLGVEVSIYTKPFTNTINFKRNTSTDFSFTYSLKSGNNCGYTINSNILLNSADYGNFTKFEENVKKVNGYFAHNALKVTYSLDVAKVKSLNKDLDQLTDSELKAVFDANVLYNSIKVADLTYDKAIEKIPFYLTFKDGSKQNASTYVGDFETRINEIFKRFFDEE